MVVAGVSIAIVWAVLLGAAWITTWIGVGRMQSAFVVSAVYVALAVLALRWLGLGWRGLAGITGMLLPFAIALTLVAVGNDHRRSHVKDCSEVEGEEGKR